MERVVTTKEAKGRLWVTKDKLKDLGHLAIDHEKSIIAISDEALAIGIRHLRSIRSDPLNRQVSHN